MIKILFKLAIFLIAFNAVAQNSLDAVIKNAEDNMPLLGANAVVAGLILELQQILTEK